MKNEQIDRLLRSAAQADEEVPAEMPFGFDTRVVALWIAVIVVSTIAAIREANQSREIRESFANEFAIADSAIQDEF